MTIMQPRPGERFRNRRRAFPQGGRRRQLREVPDRGARILFGIRAG